MEHYSLSVDELVKVLVKAGHHQLKADIVFHRLVNDETPIEKCILTGWNWCEEGFSVHKIQIWTKNFIYVNSLKFPRKETQEDLQTFLRKKSRMESIYDFHLLQFPRLESIDEIIPWELRYDS